MMQFETEVTIRATPGQVWSVLTDFARYPEWNPFIRSASGNIRPRARLRIRIHPPGGSAMTFTPKVVQVVPERELRWLGHLFVPGLFDGEHEFSIEPLSPDEVRFRQSERFRGLLVSLLPTKMFANARRGFEEERRPDRHRVRPGTEATSAAAPLRPRIRSSLRAA